ncbi:MAG: Crp/Fnr family transcriptional regulator [Bacteroidaceae bacterium]|nr:Crp/Fnr family transcriptional regulator [Bacteroidaceae bacterium]
MRVKKTYKREELLHELSLLTGEMTSNQQMDLLKHCSVKRFKVGEVISGEGDVADRLFFILKGVAKCCIRGDADRWQIVRLVKVGDYFGYRAFFANQNHMASYIAMTEMDICVISMDFIKRCLDDNTFLKDFFLKRLACSLWFSDFRFVCMIQKHLRGRMAATLLGLGENFGYREDGKTLAFETTRAELANLSNMITANAIRTLSAFVSEGLITMNKRRITILDEEALKEISIHD